MSQSLTLELSEQVFVAIQRQAQVIGISPAQLAATLLERQFPQASPNHKKLVEATIGELAFKLLKDELWEAIPGEHCDRCTYSRYCAAVQKSPEPLPENARTPQKMQLVLNLYAPSPALLSTSQYS